MSPQCSICWPVLLLSNEKWRMKNRYIGKLPFGHILWGLCWISSKVKRHPLFYLEWMENLWGSFCLFCKEMKIEKYPYAEFNLASYREAPFGCTYANFKVIFSPLLFHFSVSFGNLWTTPILFLLLKAGGIKTFPCILASSRTER